MLSRLPPVRGAVPLAVLVFLIGAGIGGVMIVLSHDPVAKRVVVRRVITATSSTSSADVVTKARAVTQDRAPQWRARGVAVRTGADASFAALQAQLGGQVGLSVARLGAGAIHTFGTLQTGHAWSTMKVPVLATLLADFEHSGQKLSAQGHTDAALALEQSDNAAAEDLFGELEQIHGGLGPASAAVQQTLGNAGDRSTTINTAPNSQGFTTWGQSEWSTGGEILFYFVRSPVAASSDLTTPPTSSTSCAT